MPSRRRGNSSVKKKAGGKKKSKKQQKRAGGKKKSKKQQQNNEEKNARNETDLADMIKQRNNALEEAIEQDRQKLEGEQQHQQQQHSGDQLAKATDFIKNEAMSIVRRNDMDKEKSLEEFKGLLAKKLPMASDRYRTMLAEKSVDVAIRDLTVSLEDDRALFEKEALRLEEESLLLILVIYRQILRLSPHAGRLVPEVQNAKA